MPNTTDLPGVHPAPNIQASPYLYEMENAAVDPDQLIEAAMWDIAPWRAQVVVDLGCGTGYHLARWHMHARHVIGIEPHGPSRLRAMARCAALDLERASIMRGSAEATGLADHSVDMVQARFAYFFAPDCEPGLREVARIIRPGGTVFIIDNNLRDGTFAAWLRRVPSFARLDPDTLDTFWRDHGFTRRAIASRWQFSDRSILEAVVKNEFPGQIAEEILVEHSGLTVDYVYDVWYRRYP